MKYLIRVIVSLLAIAPLSQVSGQTLFHINTDNGLPTNFVYHLLIDRHGYLWISSTKGIAKYNGYNFKVFNFSDGLQKEDIWRQYEDKKGRIWPSSISKRMGYIKNDRFYEIINLSGDLIYPLDIRENDSGIFFISHSTNHFLQEHKDTLRQYEIKKNAIVWMTDRNMLAARMNDSFFTGSYSCRDGKFYMNDMRFIMKDTVETEFPSSYRISSRYWIGCKRGTARLKVKDLLNKTDSIIDFRKALGADDNIQRLFAINDSYFQTRKYLMICNRQLYVIDSSLNIERLPVIDELQHHGNTGNEIIYYQDHPLWNKMIARYSDGVYINYPVKSYFLKENDLPLRDFSYKGKDRNGDGYWWNKKSGQLAQVSDQSHVAITSNKQLQLIEEFVPYSADSLLVATRLGLFWLNNKTMKTEDFTNVFRKLSSNVAEAVRTPVVEFYAIIDAGKHRYLYNAYGVAELIRKDNKELYLDFFDKDRFRGMVYDKVHDNLWVYSNDYIKIYHQRKLILTLSPAGISALHIKSIEQIFTDGYGNIYIHDYDKLIMLDGETMKYHTLFNNYMLDGALMQIEGNTLVVAGKFGMLFCAVKGRGMAGQPVVYENIKNNVYAYATDMQVLKNTVLLKTNAGLYSVPIPGPALLANAHKPLPCPFNLIFSVNNNLVRVKDRDTVNIQQIDPRIVLDVINPKGNGALHYHYKITGIMDSWTALSSSSLSLLELKPGSVYKLSLIINDEVWKSDPVEVYLYVTPYWWQTTIWKLIFWISSIGAILVFGAGVARITKKNVIEKNRRRNAMLELELKAIYSQINPHFINNTLNSALLLIRNNSMEEAYNHVFKFSRLLRAYIASSRSKYISLEDELTNLTNYIELQQKRFKGKFDYSIAISEDLETFKVKIPALLLQPFVENAINHGLLNKEGPGHLYLRFAHDGDTLKCIIEDDGIGRKTAQQLNEQTDKERQSFGNDIIKDLVDIFNRYEHIKIEVNITDKAFPLSGTIVEINIKG